MRAVTVALSVVSGFKWLPAVLARPGVGLYSGRVGGSRCPVGATGSLGIPKCSHRSPPTHSLPSFRQDKQNARRFVPSFDVMDCIHKPRVNCLTLEKGHAPLRAYPVREWA